jgi:hypothetical protein
MGESPAEEMVSKLKKFDKVTGLTINQSSGMVILINVAPGQAFGQTSPLAGFYNQADLDEAEKMGLIKKVTQHISQTNKPNEIDLVYYILA